MSGFLSERRCGFSSVRRRWYGVCQLLLIGRFGITVYITVVRSGLRRLYFGLHSR